MNNYVCSGVKKMVQKLLKAFYYIIIYMLQDVIFISIMLMHVYTAYIITHIML